MFEHSSSLFSLGFLAQGKISSVPKITKAMNPGTYIKAEIQKANCHWPIEFSMLSKCPVVCGARNPEKLATKLLIPIITLAWAGAKSNMFVLLPGTVKLLKPTDNVKNRIANSLWHFMYPAKTTVTAGTRIPSPVFSFLALIVLSQPLWMTRSVYHPPKKHTKDCRMNGIAVRKPLVFISNLENELNNFLFVKIYNLLTLEYLLGREASLNLVDKFPNWQLDEQWTLTKQQDSLKWPARVLIQHRDAYSSQQQSQLLSSPSLCQISCHSSRFLT